MIRYSIWLTVFILAAWATLAAQGGRAGKKTFTVDGVKIECLVEKFDPPRVVRADPKRTDQTSALNCSRLFYSRLAKGDIEGAVALSNDPEKVRARLTASRNRVGEQEFKKMMSTYFTGGVLLKYVFTLGERQMLVLHDKSVGVDMAQFYVAGGGVWMSDDRQIADMGIFARLFRQLKNEEGIVELKK